MSYASASRSQIRANFPDPSAINHSMADVESNSGPKHLLGAQEGNLQSQKFIYSTEQMQQPGHLLSHSEDTMTGILGARSSGMTSNPLHPEGISSGNDDR